MPIQHHGDGAPQNFQVQPERIVLNIVQIILGVQVHGAAAAAIDLPPASHARQHAKALPLPGLVLGGHIRHLGAWADQAHIAAQHIDQLRQLVEAEAPQYPPERRNPRVIVLLMDQVAGGIALRNLLPLLVGAVNHACEISA